VKRYLALILVLGCGHSPTDIGEASRCQEPNVKIAEAVQTFRLAGQTQAYALEVGACVYPISGTAMVRDSVHISFSLEQVVRR
jgi:hypothetical protein